MTQKQILVWVSLGQMIGFGPPIFGLGKVLGSNKILWLDQALSSGQIGNLRLKFYLGQAYK